MTATEHAWWRSAVVYQLYIRSFADGNDDGTGDIAGLRSRLAYLSDLGVDAIWINPWYPSPLRDGGYDVADYRDIDPRYGTLAEAEALISECHDVGMRVIVDIVPNHTSSEHPWFEAALADGPGSTARDRYLFRAGRGPNGDEPPSDWQSVFGGPAWDRAADGEWFLHLFDASQPDLNWENADVVAEFDDILRFWLDLGVDGIRVDVAHGMVKDTTFPDIGGSTELLGTAKDDDHPHWNRGGVHDINRRWRQILDGYGGRMMVAEAWLPSEQVADYLRPDEYHQSFNFDLLATSWDAEELGAAVDRAISDAASVGASPTWVLSNHDVMRHATRFGLPADTDLRRWSVTGPFDILDEELGRRRARAAVLLTMALPGSTYVYQGEELGLPEVWDLPVGVLDDPQWERSGHTQRGRDGCRVPLPWKGRGPSLGFSDGTTAPWLPQPAGFRSCAVDEQRGDESSMLELYRRTIRLRRELLAGDDSFVWHSAAPGVLDFGRDRGFRCVINLSPDSVALPAGRIVVSSVALDDDALHPDSGAWILESPAP